MSLLWFPKKIYAFEKGFISYNITSQAKQHFQCERCGETYQQVLSLQGHSRGQQTFECRELA